MSQKAPMKMQSLGSKKKAQPKGLVNKLVEVLAELGPMEKKHRNPHFGYNYISEGDVMAALRDKLSSRGVFLFTSVETIVPHYGAGEKAGVFVCVTTKHTFVDQDSKEQFVVGGGGVGWDSSDKGAYKAITGAMKYALMKNFLVTDEQDVESGDGKPPSAGSKHSRVKEYEEETGEGDQKHTSDLLQLKAFLTENKIPDAFLLRLLSEKKLIDGRTKNVAQLKPGILTRCLSPKSKENLVIAWKTQEADESEPESKPKPLKANKGNGEVIRTDEGDQSNELVRKPIQTDLAPFEVLEQDGYDGWREVPIHFGKQVKTPLGKLSAQSLVWWVKEWTPKPYKGSWDDKDILLDAALCLASLELGGSE